MIKLSLKENFSTKILNLIKICLLKIRYPFTDFSKEGIDRIEEGIRIEAEEIRCKYGTL